MENNNNDKIMVSVEVCQTNAALKIETKKNKKSKALVEPNQFVLSFFSQELYWP